MRRKKLKPGDRCEQCSGTGMMCWCCMSALDDCECGVNAEPSKCDICEGRGTLDEFMADCGNALESVDRPVTDPTDGGGNG
jgi:hypothetical protein